jgi:hypothetical protein
VFVPVVGAVVPVCVVVGAVVVVEPVVPVDVLLGVP